MTNKKFALIDTLNPGLFTTIQDKGRVGWQAHGVSVSGAADLNSMMIANLLVGNDGDAPIMECVMLAPTLSFSRDCVIATAGANTPRSESSKNVRRVVEQFALFSRAPESAARLGCSRCR